MEKKRLLVLFGGQSSEHLVSCMSAANVIDLIDTKQYEPVLVGITEEGRWLLTASSEDIRSGSWRENREQAVLSPDATDRCLLVFGREGVKKLPIDAAFPVLHGLCGEDGTVQGLFELAGLPYVGCGVLASAVSMDKLTTKVLVGALGFRQAAYLPVMKAELLADQERAAGRVEAALSYPVFVKPANAGSSRGVSKAENRQELLAALFEAAAHDRRIVVEEMIIGREIECAILGGGREPVRASGVGEILTAASFYDFEAKYFSSDSRTIVNPSLPQKTVEEVRREAVEIFRAVDGFGLARVDFFVQDDGTVIFNEINTLPGFTGISMYPMLWEAAGIPRRDLVNRLIALAFERQ